MGRSLTEMGTSKRDFVELGTLLASKTGGMDAAPLVATMRGTRMPVAKLCLGGKATADKADDLFSLMAEVLTDTNFDNPQRFTQMVLEERARLEQSLIPAGHGTVIARLRAAYSLAGQISEAIGGITYLEAIRALSERVVSDWDSVRADLEILARPHPEPSGRHPQPHRRRGHPRRGTALRRRARPRPAHGFLRAAGTRAAQGRGQRSPYRARTGQLRREGLQHL